DDTLPKRFLTEGIPKGPNKGKTVPLKPLLDDYYKERGWSPDGIPTKEKIEELGLDFYKL
ncbi:MAG: aldehyde ferredoxin oxidoreductase C-terminal domain-containing protein, partial [Thermoproteota archaeon]